MASELEAAREAWGIAEERFGTRFDHSHNYQLFVEGDFIAASTVLVGTLEAELSRTNVLWEDALQWFDDNGYRAAVVNGRLVVTDGKGSG